MSKRHPKHGGATASSVQTQRVMVPFRNTFTVELASASFAAQLQDLDLYRYSTSLGPRIASMVPLYTKWRLKSLKLTLVSSVGGIISNNAGTFSSNGITIFLAYSNQPSTEMVVTSIDNMADLNLFKLGNGFQALRLNVPASLLHSQVIGNSGWLICQSDTAPPRELTSAGTVVPAADPDSSVANHIYLTLLLEGAVEFSGYTESGVHAMMKHMAALRLASVPVPPEPDPDDEKTVVLACSGDESDRDVVSVPSAPPKTAVPLIVSAPNPGLGALVQTSIQNSRVSRAGKTAK